MLWGGRSKRKATYGYIWLIHIVVQQRPAQHWKAAIVQSLSHVQLFATLWTTALQASLSFTIAQSLFKLMSIELVMPSNHLILCRPLLLLPSIFLSIRVFSNESALHIRYTHIKEDVRLDKLDWIMVIYFPCLWFYVHGQIGHLYTNIGEHKANPSCFFTSHFSKKNSLTGPLRVCIPNKTSMVMIF